MNPPSGENLPACPGEGPAPSAADALTAPTAVDAMDQFIWGNGVAPDEAGEADAFIRTPEAGEAVPPRIVVLSDDEDESEPPEPDDEWRRQLIAALRDADRQGRPPTPPPEPDLPPLLPYVAPQSRPLSRTIAPSRPTRLVAPAPVARRAPRHRVVLPLIGTTAVATLLSAVLPHATNLSDRMVNAASATAVIVGVPEKALADEGGTLKPVMFSPVLIREGIAPSPKDAAPVLPVIETVRTVPIQLGRPPAPDTSTPFANESPELTAVSPPAPTTPSLDREGLTLLTAVPPASAPMTPVPRAQEIAPAAPQAPEPPAAAPMPRRAPQIATSYEHAPPKAPKQARKRPPRSDTKTASRTRPAQWETQRQGLRTAPPPAEEPSTMSKLVKSLWPFSSKDGSTATSKSNLGAKAPDAPGPASAPAPARSKDTFWWHEREAGR